ncbi:hypothetical protein M3Y97_00354300 [Aphelenchoides bicaudatus]|nr:hypothetical protein M3Y97_00354300 [Aphelenchoides bicaudatus]
MRLLVLLVFCLESRWLVVAQDGVMFGADEMDQPAMPKSYCDEQYQFTCASGECIAIYDRCSGIAQCLDGSDELNCPENGGFLPEQKPADETQHKVELQPKANTTASTPRYIAANGLSLRLVALGLFGILFLSALIHFVLKRRKARLASRNIRKGDSLINDEEDDLLISQMYA